MDNDAGDDAENDDVGIFHPDVTVSRVAAVDAAGERASVYYDSLVFDFIHQPAVALSAQFRLRVDSAIVHGAISDQHSVSGTGCSSDHVIGCRGR